jgi:hypothetical protein
MAGIESWVRGDTDAFIARRRSRSPVIIAAGAGGLLLLGGAAAAVIFMARLPADPPAVATPAPVVAAVPVVNLEPAPSRGFVATPAPVVAVAAPAAPAPDLRRELSRWYDERTAVVVLRPQRKPAPPHRMASRRHWRPAADDHEATRLMTNELEQMR